MSEAGNRSLTRAAAFLDAVEHGPLSASELARACEVSTSAAHRLAGDMVALGFLARGEDGRYALGARFGRSPLERVARPIVEGLRDETGETAQLWVRRGGTRVCLATADSRHELRATLPEGSSLELPAGSAGALLARRPEALASLKEHGWVESVSQRTPGLASVSAPVVLDGNLIGAVCVPVPIARLSGPGEPSPGRAFGAPLLEAAARIAAAAAGEQPS